jgi:hypothetical protein
MSKDHGAADGHVHMKEAADEAQLVAPVLQVRDFALRGHYPKGHDYAKSRRPTIANDFSLRKKKKKKPEILRLFLYHNGSDMRHWT